MRGPLLRVTLSLLLLASATGASARGEEPFSLRDLTRPGRVEAVKLSVRGTDEISEGRPAEGASLLEQALRLDPYLAPAWTNLSAGYITLCRPEGALVASMIGRIFDPASKVAADNLRIAMELSCDDAPSESFVSPEEVAALRAQSDPALFESAAASRRARGDHVLAVFYEEWALRLGGDQKSALGRISADLASAGLLRAAQAALAARESAEDAARLERLASRRAALEGLARSVSERIAEEGHLDAPEERDAILRYAEVLLARGQEQEAVVARLRELLGIGAPSTLREAWGTMRIGAEWALLRDDARGAPLATLRRFPGDTQITLYPWSGPFAPESASTRLLKALAARSALIVEPWSECPPRGPEGHCTRTLLEVDSGMHGSARVEARLYGARKGAPTLAALVLVGDEGCGTPCREGARLAADEVLGTLVPAAAAPRDPPATWRLPLPAAWRAERPYEESSDPWRTHPIGASLRLDLPPGFVVGRVNGPFSDDSCARETQLWLRGGFTDVDGVAVQVGDEEWSGWVDYFPGASGLLDERREVVKKLAPRTDPSASFATIAGLDEALSKGRRPMRGHVALFDSASMPGRWLVYDLALGGDLVVVTLPVIEGARSLSLHWIALTLRREAGEELPPPVDLSEALDVDFQRFEGRDARRDPREGVLRAGELQVAVPRGYRVSLSASSRDGFPVTFRSEGGGKIVIDRLPPARSADLAARLRQAEALLGPALEPGWQSERLGRSAELAAAAFAADGEGGGERRVLIVAPRDTGAAAFRVVMTRADASDQETWDFEGEIVKDSLRLRRARGARGRTK